MRADNAQDMYQKMKENRSEEAAALYQVMLGLAERDSFPSMKITKVKDADNRVVGYSFDFVNPWYVAEPISTIQNMILKINGEEIRQEDIFIVIRGQKVPVKVAKTFHELWWGFGEIAQIFIESHYVKEGLLRAENELEIQLDMRTTMHYGIPGDLVRYATKKMMEVQ
jgi:hypothetical protein